MPRNLTCQLPNCNAEINPGNAHWIMIISRENQDDFLVDSFGICETCHELLFEKEQSYEHKLNAAIATYTIEKYHSIDRMAEPGKYEEGIQTALKPIMDLLLPQLDLPEEQPRQQSSKSTIQKVLQERSSTRIIFEFLCAILILPIAFVFALGLSYLAESTLGPTVQLAWSIVAISGVVLGVAITFLALIFQRFRKRMEDRS